MQMIENQEGGVVETARKATEEGDTLWTRRN